MWGWDLSMIRAIVVNLYLVPSSQCLSNDNSIQSLQCRIQKLEGRGGKVLNV